GPPRADVRRAEVGAESKRGQAWFEKGSGTFVRSTLRALWAKVPDPFSNQAPLCGTPCEPFGQRCLTPFRTMPRNVQEALSYPRAGGSGSCRGGTRMVATRFTYSRTDPVGRIAGLLLAGLLFCVPAARAEGPVAGEGLFITVRNPITSDEMSRVKEATEEARRRLARVPRHQGDARLKIVYDFNPDNRPGETSLYGPCRDLAKYLLDLHDVTTIAYVHARVSRHTILPVLACHELVMSPGGAIGNDKPDPGERYPEDVTQF